MTVAIALGAPSMSDIAVMAHLSEAGAGDTLRAAIAAC
jgi:hypothetical protein